MEEKKISIAVIKRLPRYYRYLSDLLDSGIKRISSKELSDRMNLTASQIRQDFNCFGGFGQQGYGYNVQKLYGEIAEILGISNAYNVIIIGAGNMGHAIAKYGKFKKRGYSINAIFDNNPEVVGTKVNKLTVQSIDEMQEYLKNNKTDIAVMTVPKASCKDLVKAVAAAGVKGIWNFSTVDLHEEEEKNGIIVENVHLSDNIMVLGYRLRNE